MSNSSDLSSIDSNRVAAYDEPAVHQHEPLAKKITHSLEHLRSRSSEEEKELERLVIILQTIILLTLTNIMPLVRWQQRHLLDLSGVLVFHYSQFKCTTLWVTNGLQL